jgi:hypothetical protein
VDIVRGEDDGGARYGGAERIRVADGEVSIRYLGTMLGNLPSGLNVDGTVFSTFSCGRDWCAGRSRWDQFG